MGIAALNPSYVLRATFHPGYPFGSGLSGLGKRGFNQSLILAELIYSQLKNTGKECLLDSQNLCRTRFTAQQAKLDRRARQKNLRNAFCWNLDAVVPERILLVDDVITSGATARECARVLKQHGAKFVWVAALARG